MQVRDCASQKGGQREVFCIDPQRLWSRLMDMAEIGEIPGNGSRRLALSQDDLDGRELFLAWCTNRGFQTSFDKVGNLFVRRLGKQADALPVAIGSHLDTQPNGGRFDGVLGVLAGLEVLETLEDNGIETDAPIDVVVWMNEEGTRFAPAMMGSGVYSGSLSFPAVLTTRDAEGVSISKELEKHGYSKGLPPGFHRIGKYMELHIEQGPILEENEKVIGVVTGGQSIRWYDLTIEGEETHAGPSPMASRCDPVPALSRVIDQVFQLSTRDDFARATMGQIKTRPGSVNVVPGEVRTTIDLRHPDDAMLSRMHEQLLQCLQDIHAAFPRLELSVGCTWHSPAVTFDPGMRRVVQLSAEQRGYSAMELVSGAGHDAFNLARIVPTTMIFVPCEDGISHNEREYATPEHCAAGANVLLDVALKLACETNDAL